MFLVLIHLFILNLFQVLSMVIDINKRQCSTHEIWLPCQYTPYPLRIIFMATEIYMSEPIITSWTSESTVVVLWFHTQKYGSKESFVCFEDPNVNNCVPVMVHSHCTGPELGQYREMMGFNMTLCTVHTTQGQEQGIIVFYFTHPVPYPSPRPFVKNFEELIKWTSNF